MPWLTPAGTRPTHGDLGVMLLYAQLTPRRASTPTQFRPPSRHQCIPLRTFNVRPYCVLFMHATCSHMSSLTPSICWACAPMLHAPIRGSLVCSIGPPLSITPQAIILVALARRGLEFMLQLWSTGTILSSSIPAVNIIPDDSQAKSNVFSCCARSTTVYAAPTI